MKIAAILVSVAAAISAGAISEESKTIEGQVFIVTGAHESIKLGLVAVAAFNQEEFARSISAVQPGLEAERQELDGLKPSVQRLTSKTKALRDAAWRQHPKTLSRSDASMATTWSELFARASVIASRISWRKQYLASAAPFFKSLPKPIGIVKTDADGKFKLDVSSDKIVLAATATRKVLDEQENYFWAINVKPPANVTLSNDNLTDAASAESALQTGPLSETAGEKDSTKTLSSELEQLIAAASKLASDLKSNAPPAATQPESPQTVTLTRPVVLQIEYGSVSLPAGTKLQFISRDAANVRVRYMGADQLIPISSTDFK